MTPLRPGRAPERLVPSLLAIVMAAGCGGPAAAPKGPTAAFTTTPICDLVPALTLTDKSTEGDAKLVGWAWSFDDGTSASGPVVDHRWPGQGKVTVPVGLSVTDANGLGDYVSKNLDVQTCLETTPGTVSIDGSNATAHMSFKNVSGYDDALVSFSLDILDADGLPLAVGLDAGQVVINKGQTTNVLSVEPVPCGTECPAFAAGTVVAHVTSTYWCQGTCK